MEEVEEVEVEVATSPHLLLVLVEELLLSLGALLEASQISKRQPSGRTFLGFHQPGASSSAPVVPVCLEEVQVRVSNGK